MIAMDPIVMEFLSKNYLTIMGILYVLQIIAKETPWAADDKIVQIFLGWMKRRKLDTEKIIEMPKEKPKEKPHEKQNIKEL